MAAVQMVIHGLGWLAAGMTIAGCAYLALAARLSAKFFGAAPPIADESPPVTLLKPLKGADPGLEQRLEGFCRQAYAGKIQIVFGVQDPNDPAIAIVRALQARLPNLAIELVVNESRHGANLKVSNLLNMIGSARHDLLVISDADIAVSVDYLSQVTAATRQPDVGVATCLYTGGETGGLWSALSAMVIDYQFLPSAIVGKTTRLAEPCFGATITIDKATLARIGGFEATADCLADDHEIGRLVRALGLRVRIAPKAVVHVCDEHTARAFVDRSLRWGRTLRQIDPLGYAGSLVTYPLPLAMIAAALLGPAPTTIILVLGALCARLAFRATINRATGASAGRWWLLPIGDILSFAMFVASFGVDSVGWRGSRFRVSRAGALLHS